MPERTLYRSTSNRMISGICGGLGEYFDVDTSVIRIALSAFTVISLPVFGPFVLIAYLVCIFIIPRNPGHTLVSETRGEADSENSEDSDKSGSGDRQDQVTQAGRAGRLSEDHQNRSQNNSMVWGILFIMLAVVVLSYSFLSGPAHFSFLLPLIPVIAIAAAVVILLVYRGEIMAFFRHRRLYRLREGKKIFGVCAGLADAFDVDPTLVRIGFFIAFLFSVGTVTLIYLFMAFIMPVGRPESPVSES